MRIRLRTQTPSHHNLFRYFHHNNNKLLMIIIFEEYVYHRFIVIERCDAKHCQIERHNVYVGYDLPVDGSTKTEFQK